MEILAVVLALAIVVLGLATVLLVRARDAARTRASVAVRASNELHERLGRTETERRSMQVVLSSMHDGVVLVQPDGSVTFSNAAAEAVLGVAPTSLDAMVPLGLRDAVRVAIAERIPRTVTVETGAPSRWLRGDAMPVDERGAVLLVVRDVTEARRNDAIRRDFVANASHELKTPAASIQAAAETIATAARDDPAVVPRFAAQLEREASRLSRIVSDLLDLSRLETGSELDELVPMDGLVRDEVERFEGQAAEGGVTFQVQVDSVPRIRGSARELALMVRNLVDNAIRYTRPGGRIDVRLTRSGSQVVLTVADTGIGIPTRDLGRVFERFYRVDRARSRETGGTGLGLSIVRHVVENHGGTVGVTSELGVGSTFEVRLPVAP
ncbi:MAG TPA: ATP-binding protein [Actinomycetota bacterium]|nr:ATP-binding protein [Actinomycetota bacterium]